MTGVRRREERREVRGEERERERVVSYPCGNTVMCKRQCVAQNEAHNLLVR
jgi:hypothetical protein